MYIMGKIVPRPRKDIIGHKFVEDLIKLKVGAFVKYRISSSTRDLNAAIFATLRAAFACTCALARCVDRLREPI